MTSNTDLNTKSKHPDKKITTTLHILTTNKTLKSERRNQNLEESPRVRTEELPDLRVLRENLASPRSVRFVGVWPKEVSGHYTLVSLFTSLHYDCLRVALAPRRCSGGICLSWGLLQDQIGCGLMRRKKGILIQEARCRFRNRQRLKKTKNGNEGDS